MARSSFRDRFLTPPVARAIMSPLGIVLFGAAAAGAILIGAPIVAAAGIGAVAWGGQVLAAVPRDPRRGDRIEPFTLSDPWKSYVIGAQQSKERFDRMVHDMAAGPLKERLADLAARLDDGVAESWRIARRGNDISGALARLDTVSARAELAELQATTGNAMPQRSTAKTIEALEAQIASAQRLQADVRRRPVAVAAARRPVRRARRAWRRGEHRLRRHRRLRQRSRRARQRARIAPHRARGDERGRRGTWQRGPAEHVAAFVSVRI